MRKHYPIPTTWDPQLLETYRSSTELKQVTYSESLRNVHEKAIFHWQGMVTKKQGGNR